MKYISAIAVIALFTGCATLQKQSTAELKLRHVQCVQYLSAEKKDFEFRFGPPLAMAFQGDPRKDRIEEKEKIEKELLRRWKAGDKEAFLPVFEN